MDDAKARLAAPVKSPYEAYGALARAVDDSTAIAGRFAQQADAERLILADIAPKLALEPAHRLLEIGCGVGNLLVPLSFQVRHAVGIDHPDVIAKAANRFDDPRIKWLSGEFPHDRPAGKFDRILVYSVMHYMRSGDDVMAFIDSALSLLPKTGRLLVADLPNADRRRRFLGSEAGRAFDAAWRAERAQMTASQNDRLQGEIFSTMEQLVAIDDALVMRAVSTFRLQGYHAYVLPQDPRLPFGHTREDLLIVKP